ncbi:Ribosomal protein arginine N-methyltransferase-like protein [Emericellopsis cladophorae]|uniref:type I protein arginine methyltransferase n=1 Tax=Emericellopsis cladophorae TaxID=2686198 RepID=A0A9Q0BDL5_9HYPO|nr:Ribosomal protein arginine N-methyltransferase-like protein [Emericellopsis cladophorae]KAI6780304.1 Ribosomal protein arginine N-methyltransferase-like protein [Emericellopsis cladophorae]
MPGNRDRDSASSASESSEGSDWQDVEPDEEPSTVVSLFDEQTFPNPKEMLAYCKNKHNFDLLAIVKRLGLDFYGAIKLVNYVRSKVQSNQPLPEQISAKDIEDDQYLKPVLENDALLFTLDEVLEADQETTADPATRARALEEELENLRDQFANYRLTVEQTLDKRWGDDAEPTPLTSAPKKDDSEYYFESYAAHEIHETMLKDAVRTDAYRDFIYNNKQLFKDKVVLDIGCGTGILSMFCAKAGAKQVISVDKSDIMTKARENIFNNGLSDVITCVKGAIEDVVLPVDKVDVIVSEWMGYFLLYEAMLPSVLYARDRYLKPDGILAPSSATMWMAPVADPEFVGDHIHYWRDVYGFDFKAMQEGIYDEARIEVVPKESVCGKPYPFKVLDLMTVKKEELFFTEKWESTLDKDIDMLDGFLIWFDNHFNTNHDEPAPAPEVTPEEWNKQKQGNVAFSTGPFTTPTHWKQGYLLMPPDDSRKDLKAGTKLTGEIIYTAAEDNARALTVGAKWAINDQEMKSRSWKMK